MFHFWINTAFIDREYLCLHKNYIDGADKDKSNKEFDADFKVELFLDRVRGLACRILLLLLSLLLVQRMLDTAACLFLCMPIFRMTAFEKPIG